MVGLVEGGRWLVVGLGGGCVHVLVVALFVCEALVLKKVLTVALGSSNSTRNKQADIAGLS